MNVVSALGAGAPTYLRRAFTNFTWTDECINKWEYIWSILWRLGIRWEWQNSDRYVRRYGDTFKRFSVHNDAVRLDMALPLPNCDIIAEIYTHLLRSRAALLKTDEMNYQPSLEEALHLLEEWIKEYVESS